MCICNEVLKVFVVNAYDIMVKPSTHLYVSSYTEYTQRLGAPGWFVTIDASVSMGGQLPQSTCQDWEHQAGFVVSYASVSMGVRFHRVHTKTGNTMLAL